MAKILLVEDDNNLREIYEARLQAEGYTIVSAQDGEEALVKAKQERPDLIISDVMMPRISGFEMLDILRNTEGLKEVKVIMLTALGQAEDKTRADALGADRYLVKSQVTLEDIVHAADELLNDGKAPADTATQTTTAAAPTPEVAAPTASTTTPTVAPMPVQAPPADTTAPTGTAPVATPSPTPVEPPTANAPTSTPAAILSVPAVAPAPVIPVAAPPTAAPAAPAISMPQTPASTPAPAVEAVQTASPTPAAPTTAATASPEVPKTAEVTTAVPDTAPVVPETPVVEAEPVATPAPTSEVTAPTAPAAPAPEASSAAQTRQADDKIIADAMKELTQTLPSATPEAPKEEKPSEEASKSQEAPTETPTIPETPVVEAEPVATPAPTSEVTAPTAPAVPEAAAVPATEDAPTAPENAVVPSADIAGATPTADEQALMQQQINSFINQQDTATPDTTGAEEPAVDAKPAATPEPTPEPVSTETEAPAEAPATDTNRAFLTPAPDTVAAPAPEATTFKPDDITPAEPQPVVAGIDGDNVNIAHKKTIQPPVEPITPQTDLNELLAREGIGGLEEHDDEDERPAPGPYASPPHQPGHVISPNGGNGISPDDPNNIAL